MLSLGIPELLVLLAAVLMGYGSYRIPQLMRAADGARRGFQPGARLSTDQPFEPVGLTLRQIQFRRSAPDADPRDMPVGELDTEPDVVEPTPVTIPLLTFSGARRVPVSAGPVDSAGIDGWDIFV
jgi:hypothetical protein